MDLILLASMTTKILLKSNKLKDITILQCFFPQIKWLKNYIDYCKNCHYLKE